MRRGFGFHDRHSPFRFNPATLFAGGVQGAWYDPSDITTLFQDAAGTTPVTAAGQPVGLIQDKSGNGYHATQTGTLRPTFQQSDGLSFLAFDGSNDGLDSASINLSNTGKLTCWAGVRKLSDAALGFVAEFSVSLSGNNGVFWLINGDGSVGPGPNWQFASKGTVNRFATSPGNYASPISNVLTGAADITAPFARLRVNGTQVANTTAGQGTGNFGNYPLYIGRRSSGAFPFNGNLYGLIVLGAAASDWQVYVTEQWMAGKTGVTI
jgi:hypothetical protein